MKIFKKIESSGTFYDLCKYFDLLTSPDVRMKKFVYWDYYELIKKEESDRAVKQKIYHQIVHFEKFNYFNKNGLTKRGIMKLIILKARKEKAEDKWDKKWRIVIFDIPEKIRKKRDGFRWSLKNMGFLLLQNSIWISPFGNLNDIQLLIKKHRIAEFVVFIVAEKISNDLLYKAKFKID
jgi:hypothetical protein